jgi:hypothetical protein
MTRDLAKRLLRLFSALNALAQDHPVIGTNASRILRVSSDLTIL